LKNLLLITQVHLTIGWISILSASVLMVLSSNSHQHQNVANDDDNQTKTIHNSHLNGVGFEALMHKVEWSTLLFFSGLFIFMKTIEELGLLNYIGNESTFDLTKINTLIRIDFYQKNLILF
jgi:Na+/H+ antiporter NhaD/arsenite permease-like protein